VDLPIGAAREEDNCYKGTRGKEGDKAITGRPVKMLRRTHEAPPLPCAAEPPIPSAAAALSDKKLLKTNIAAAVWFGRTMLTERAGH